MLHNDVDRISDRLLNRIASDYTTLGARKKCSMIFANFSKFSLVVLSFWICSDLLGPVWMYSDVPGCVEVCSDSWANLLKNAFSIILQGLGAQEPEATGFEISFGSFFAERPTKLPPSAKKPYCGAVSSPSSRKVCEQSLKTIVKLRKQESTSVGRY